MYDGIFRKVGSASLAALATVGLGACADTRSIDVTTVQPERSDWFRYYLSYSLASEIQARMAMMNEFIGGVSPDQFATEEQWQRYETLAEEACATAGARGWSQARLDLEGSLQTGVTSGEREDSSIFVGALVSAAVADGSFCHELAEDVGA